MQILVKLLTINENDRKNQKQHTQKRKKNREDLVKEEEKKRNI